VSGSSLLAARGRWRAPHGKRCSEGLTVNSNTTIHKGRDSIKTAWSRMLMADTQKEILMLLEHLVDAISSKPQVEESLLFILREIMRMMGQKKGSSSHIQSSEKPQGSNQRKKNMSILIDLVGKFIVEVYNHVWDHEANRPKESFSNRNPEQRNDNIQNVAQMINTQYINTAEGKEFSDQEWYKYTNEVLAQIFAPSVVNMFFSTVLNEILTEALKMRPTPR
jgi:hypothetical protein